MNYLRRCHSTRPIPSLFPLLVHFSGWEFQSTGRLTLEQHRPLALKIVSGLYWTVAWETQKARLLDVWLTSDCWWIQTDSTLLYLLSLSSPTNDDPWWPITAEQRSDCSAVAKALTNIYQRRDNEHYTVFMSYNLHFWHFYLLCCFSRDNVLQCKRRNSDIYMHSKYVYIDFYIEWSRSKCLLLSHVTIVLDYMNLFCHVFLLYNAESTKYFIYIYIYIYKKWNYLHQAVWVLH